jgi:RNA polymerase sigma-70 factor (ECF subfamily)
MDFEEATVQPLESPSPVQPVDWNAVYSEQLPRIYNFLRFRVGRRADAEELTSRTFEKAWSARDRYRRDVAGFSTWLIGIARNVATDHLRSARNHLSIDAAMNVSSGVTAEDEVARLSDIERLVALMSALEDREAELIALKYGAELNNRAIARLTGLSESNVGTLLHRLVEKLRARW